LNRRTFDAWCDVALEGERHWGSASLLLHIRLLNHSLFGLLFDPEQQSAAYDLLIKEDHQFRTEDRR
jgi:hypothetical protein